MQHIAKGRCAEPRDLVQEAFFEFLLGKNLSAEG